MVYLCDKFKLSFNMFRRRVLISNDFGGFRNNACLQEGSGDVQILKSDQRILLPLSSNTVGGTEVTLNNANRRR